jgi:hypothetical protein
MKKYTVLAILVVLISACKSEPSKSQKGAWTTDEKKQIEKVCSNDMKKHKESGGAKPFEEIGIKFDDFAQKACDCFIQKVESKYNNIAESEKDAAGLEKIAGECGKELVLKLMKK